MSVTIRGTDNSASTPAVTGTDGDTGLYFPATNQLSLATNGTQALIVDSSQNVGIGTSSPINNSGYGGLTLNGTSGSLFSLMTNGSESGRIASLGDETSVQCKASTGYINFVQGVSGGTVRGRFDSAGNFQYNSGYGSVATAYGCRAWVNFTGTGTPTIQASGNVSSITDNNVGNYTVNFTNAMPDVNYAVGICGDGAATAQSAKCFTTYAQGTTTSQQMLVYNPAAGVFQDPAYVFMTIFR